jgi:tetratricopeptide (TPR) repeat protein
MVFIPSDLVLIHSHANPTMTQPETTDATLSPEEETTTAPEPEPWTPERVTAWNTYYDLYVAAGVLLLVFIVSATKISNSSVWWLLQAGRLSVSQGWPIVKDPFSYTQQDKPWINVPWAFEVVNSLVYQSIAPESLDRRPGQVTQADQNAAGALVAINATIRVLTGLLLLSIRRRGPGLWWTAICAGLALGGILGPPSGFALGGIAGQASVTPDTWGLLFFTVELVVLHRALNNGQRSGLLGLVPLFLVWANADESFVTGLIALAAAGFGTLQKPEKGETRALTFGRAMGLLGMCAAVCLVNPSFYHVFEAALSPLTQLFTARQDTVPIDQISFFGQAIRIALRDYYRWLIASYLILVGMGLGSFYLNRRRFSLSRFLIFAIVAVMWGAVYRFRAEFAVVFATTLALNGQEWYQDQVGLEGRLGRGWAVWSIGGRAITIVVTCLFIVKGLTGYGSEPGSGEPVFGLGLNPDLFPFEAADTLRAAKIDGNVLNTSPSQGDALIWRAYPTRKTFIDSRPHVFPPLFRARFDELRKALRDDDVAKWKPILDEYHITAVMLDVAGSPNTFDQLRHSPNWIPFYDDGNVVMFGRNDASDPDLAYFKDNVLDADTLVYQKRRPVESTQSPPRLVAWFDRYYDRIFQYRNLAPPQPHVKAASRWIEQDPNQSFAIPDPAHCLMAVWHARTALARRPDDPTAFRILVEAYRWLMLHESAILEGRTLTPANVGQITTQPRLLVTRYEQRVTSLNYAIRTMPPPRSETARNVLRDLNGELGQLYLAFDFLDLARDRFQAVIDLTNPADLAPEFRIRLSQINEQLNQVQTRLNQLPEPYQNDQIYKAREALRLGAAGLAIEELSNAEQLANRQRVARPLLVDLYCQTGQPDRALDLLGQTEDESLNTGPGTAARRQGLVNFLVGNSEYASLLWQDRALPQIRGAIASQAIQSTQVFLRGDVRAAMENYLELPNRVATEASWEVDLALCLLEAGEPTRAAEHFTNALKLAPTIPLRPVIAYYLEKLGEPVPPLPGGSPTSPGAPNLLAPELGLPGMPAKGP